MAGHRDGLPDAERPLDVEAVVEAAAGRRWQGFPYGGIVGHIHLQVGAIAPAEAFYGDLLGFDVTCRYPGGSFFGSGGYHHQIATNIWNSRNASPRLEPVTGLVHFELLARDRPIADATAQRLAAASIATTPLERGFAVRDPWGTLVHVRDGLSGRGSPDAPQEDTIMLVNGQWSAAWHPVQAADAKGGFVRQTSSFRHWITPDGRPGPTGEGGFPGRARSLPSLRRPHLSLGLAHADRARPEAARSGGSP